METIMLPNGRLKQLGRIPLSLAYDDSVDLKTILNLGKYFSGITLPIDNVELKFPGTLPSKSVLSSLYPIVPIPP